MSRPSRHSKSQRAKASADARRAGKTPPNHETSTETPHAPNQGERPDLSGITNPWEYLEKVRQIPKQFRGGYTNAFLKLCSTLPEIESDALVKAGAEVFGYLAKTAYDAVRKFREATRTPAHPRGRHRGRGRGLDGRDGLRPRARGPGPRVPRAPLRSAGRPAEVRDLGDVPEAALHAGPGRR